MGPRWTPKSKDTLSTNYSVLGSEDFYKFRKIQVIHNKKPLRFYFDTSIWLDLLENRNEPSFPRGDLAKQLFSYILKTDSILYFSDLNEKELRDCYIPLKEIQTLLQEPFISYLEISQKHIKRAKEIARQRKIPTGDVVHALVAKDTYSTMITYDKHFKELKDFLSIATPRDFT
tara:strand:- start:2265 stop:2786 length:522 start_codon:yes stop_codon:yes gene_type:complete